MPHVLTGNSSNVVNDAGNCNS